MYPKAKIDWRYFPLPFPFMLSIRIYHSHSPFPFEGCACVCVWGDCSSFLEISRGGTLLPRERTVVLGSHIPKFPDSQISRNSRFPNCHTQVNLTKLALPWDHRTMGPGTVDHGTRGPGTTVTMDHRTKHQGPWDQGPENGDQGPWDPGPGTTDQGLGPATKVQGPGPGTWNWV